MKKILTFMLFSLIFSALFSNTKILVDGSGSMRGFAKQNSISGIVNQIDSAINTNNMQSELSVFINKRNSDYYEVSPSKEDLDKTKTYCGHLTLLDQAFANNINNDMFLIITDNVYDNDNSLGSKSTLNFYKLYNGSK